MMHQATPDLRVTFVLLKLMSAEKLNVTYARLKSVANIY